VAGENDEMGALEVFQFLVYPAAEV
jgi:hypothetical protein